MDASASTQPDADNTTVYGFFLKIDGSNFPTTLKQKSTVIKYTKLPDFEFDSKVSWPLHSYTLQPRLRRIISLDDDDLYHTNRSLKPSYTPPPQKIMATNNTKRKIVTISEADDKDRRSKLTKERKPRTAKTVNRSAETDMKEKQSTNRTTSRLTSSKTYSKEIKTSAKTNSTYNKKEVNVTQQNFRNKQIYNLSAENVKTKNVKEKETVRNHRSPNRLLKSSVSKNLVTTSESDKELTRIKHILYDNLKSNTATCKKSPEKSKPSKPSSKPKLSLLKDNQCKRAPVIHVPLEDKYMKRNKCSETVVPIEEPAKVDQSSDTIDVVRYKDVNIGTDPLPTSVHRLTDMDDFEINTVCKCESTVQTETFDSLEIPNVTLTKEKCDPKEVPTTGPEIIKNVSLPNLEAPPLKIASHKEVTSSDINYCPSASYIISRATLTYTTRQKINIHVVGNDDEVRPTQPPSPLDYPVSVVSIFKNELKNKNINDNVSSDDSLKKKNTSDEYINCLNELQSLNCSYVFNKLMKPSDIISTIKVNNGLLHNDYICEQFQRELNFIDSFFESLQYLESCSLSDKCCPENKVESLVNNSVLFDSTFYVKNSEYDNFLSKLENGANIDDTETMASKSLCLLNLLIRDEQRRAKNLLFVLKMREDALKDFTKSQILWLEKKKKRENTDISTLKKKQRGALLKLQHECGEMQRMRKALLTLSEKRKVALMKTKKNIELKLKNNVDVEQIILGKKKLKRSASTDRNTTPLKCFDLSSSGCEDSTTSRPNSDAALVAPEVLVSSVTSAEKCVQTGDAPSPALMDSATDTAAENFVAVDGGYLNILFHNLTSPHIFSSGKQYEVNEEALRNIVNSVNSHNNNISGSDVVEKFMDQIKNKEPDRSTTPSTARSLIEEYDQYYKNLNEDDKSSTSSVNDNSCKVYEIKESSIQSTDYKSEPGEEPLSPGSTLTYKSEANSNFNDTKLAVVDNPCVCESVVSVESQCSLDKEPVGTSQTATGPLPVPVGAAAVVESQLPDIPPRVSSKTSVSTGSDTESFSSQPVCASTSSLSSLVTPAHCEAEELRRQQLAIEREIKALEQQQCRLLVVREIPDKPPPPYTPPTETRAPKLPRMFTPDESIKEKIEKHIADPNGASYEPTEAFDVFLADYCQESLQSNKQEQSDKPWEACNLLPQKPQVDVQKLVEKTATELNEVLTTVPPSAVSGVSSRRSDHIDDILFAEWRRCEPEWTALHTDEAIVKNQIFESIFQKILNDTVDEYKKAVQCNVITD